MSIVFPGIDHVFLVSKQVILSRKENYTEKNCDILFTLFLRALKNYLRLSRLHRFQKNDYRDFWTFSEIFFRLKLPESGKLLIDLGFEIG
jgi:hypothetical protein